MAQVNEIKKYYSDNTHLTTQSLVNSTYGSFQSFEEVYKTSYSHGLEDIYHIETVDLKTVRRLNDFSPQMPQKIKKSDQVFVQTIEMQLEFDFGDGYRESMDSFVLEEPIQVLGVSKYAEKCLNENGMFTLRQLLKADLTQFVYLKGMGQGHIDEIKQKLNEYISNRSLYRSSTIDFYAWMRSLILGYNNKKMYVMLEPFKLSDLCTLSLAEGVEVRRLSAEKRQEWRQEIALELNVKKTHVQDDMKKVIEAYILPWMRRRQGFATQQEILERVQRVSTASTGAQQVFLFFTEVFFDNQFPLSQFLLQGEESLFFINHELLQAFNTVVDKAKTYFYKSGLSYALNELIMLLEREFALYWQSFQEGFIEKCLRTSVCFRVRKAESGHLTVRLV